MLTHPAFDPVALALGPVKIHWYGIMYMLGFAGFYWLSTRRGRYPWLKFWTPERVSDVLFYGVVGVILGGRIGYTFFYNVDAAGHLVFLSDPLVIFRIWQGGMSFHGGLIGVLVAMQVYAWQHRLSFWTVTDFIAVAVPVGLLTGRIGNFINGELYGAPTDLPWGMVFPALADGLPRHPSMLYEAALEGAAMLAILWWFGGRPRPRMAISGLFLILYGAFRFAVEFVRVPDSQIGYLHGTSWFTMGMQLCVPMLVLGVTFMVIGYRRNKVEEDASVP
jgi:phosphatidylglycerol:prolipoprotein diacylglycerol transferase